MRNSVSRKLRIAAALAIAWSVFISAVLIAWLPAAAQDQAKARATDVLIELLQTASGEGMFIGREEYSDLRGAVTSLDETLAKEKLTPEEAASVGAVLSQVEQRRAEWLKRLIDSVKDLRTKHDKDALPSVDLTRLAVVCGDNLSSGQTQVIIDSLTSLAEGGTLTAGQLQTLSEYRGATGDCERTIVSFIAEITNYTAQLQQEIAALQDRIDQKQKICNELEAGAEKEKCQSELKTLEDDLKKKTETYREAKEVEKSGKDFKILLAALAVIGGVVALYYGDVQTAFAAFALADQLFKEANEKDIQEIEKTREDGVERDIKGATTASPEELDQLKQQAANEGLEPVTFENNKGDFSVSIFQKPGQVKVYLASVKLPDGSGGARLVADLSEANTVIAENRYKIAKLSDLKVTIIRGSIFGERNAVVMSGEATDANNTAYKISISERSVGQKEFTITLDQ